MTDPNPQAPLILFVDDEATAVKYFQRAIGSLATVLTAGTVEEGKQLLDAHAGSLAVVVSDQRMPGAYGNELLSYAWDRYPHIVRILTTAYSELEHTVEAVNLGQIHRYIQKPWEIAALRVEMKQALELARLRKEHAQLLREKLLVRQKQIVANRIGAVYALCATLAEPSHYLPIEAYLSTVLAAGLTPPEPDWLVMDFSDLIAAEAFRAATFSCAVRDHLARIEENHPGALVEKAIDMLRETFGERVQQLSASSLMFLDSHTLTEFLETPSAVAASSEHAFWLACLLWLGRRGWSLRITRTESGLQCILGHVELPVTPGQLAAWIEQF
jgi:two-component system probable response regulator PhcQ